MATSRQHNYDPRLNAFRTDLADERLKEVISASVYVEGQSRFVKLPFADIFKSPDPGSGLQAQILYGHEVLVFEETDEWYWVQNQTDQYVGYIQRQALDESISDSEPTHIVLAPRTFIYPKPDLKLHRQGQMSIGSKINVVDFQTTRGTDYAILESGEAMIAGHVLEIGNWKLDPVDVAETMLHTPYLWGGNSGFGVDCSGLVSLSYMLCGKSVMRDSDMQAASIGMILETNYSDLQRGDLVFWNGHVGMMADGENILHANGNTMDVALENLFDAIKRIGYLYGQPTAVRRPASSSRNQSS